MKAEQQKLHRKPEPFTVPGRLWLAAMLIVLCNACTHQPGTNPVGGAITNTIEPVAVAPEPADEPKSAVPSWL